MKYIFLNHLRTFRTSPVIVFICLQEQFMIVKVFINKNTYHLSAAVEPPPSWYTLPGNSLRAKTSARHLFPEVASSPTRKADASPRARSLVTKGLLCTRTPTLRCHLRRVISGCPQNIRRCAFVGMKNMSSIKYFRI